MATPRLTFLYPIFYRPPIVTECGPLLFLVRRRPPRNFFSTGPKRRDTVQQEEHKPGTVLPPQVINKKRVGGNMSTQKSTPEKEHEKLREGRSSDNERPARDTSSSDSERPARDTSSDDDDDKATSNAPRPPPKESQEAKAQDATILADTPQPSQAIPRINPIDTVLSMSPPAGQSPEEKPPHLQPPPYVH